MHYSYYLFALFVATLIAAVLFMNDRLRRSRISDSDTLKAREARLFSLYQNIEDLSDAMEEYVDETMASLAEKRLELEEKEQALAELAQSLQANAAAAPQAPSSPFSAPVLLPRQAKRGGEPSKAQRVQYLRDQGFDEERIAQELSMSLGEVLLIVRMVEG